jgi:hypothetical protein
MRVQFDGGFRGITYQPIILPLRFARHGARE